MTLPTVDQLDELSRADLLALVKTLLVEVQRLQAENRELKAELEKWRRPPASSRNSSQPPSRDQKSNLPRERKKKKLGPPFGHQRATRPLAEHPDRIIEAPVEQCLHCQADLRGVAPQATYRRQITELPEIKPVVIELQQHEVCCPHCLKVSRGSLPAGLEAGRCFGPRLEASVVYLKHEQHLSYERVSQAMADLFGVSLSEGGASRVLQRVGEAAQPVAAEIGARVTASEIIGSDETSARVQGRNWWEWVFLSAAGIYHLIRPTRSSSVIAEVMGQQRAKCWVCDCFGAQLKAPAEHFQLCLAHQLRDLERLLEARPRLCWAVEMQALMREAIHLWKRVAELTLDGFMRRVAELENRLDRLLQRRLSGAEAERLQQRYLEHRDHLLTFLYYPGVPPDNNACERALRPSVIHRKVTNGFRSEWGAQAYAALQTIMATARQQSKRVFDELVKLCGLPVLHFLVPQNS